MEDEAPEGFWIVFSEDGTELSMYSLNGFQIPVVGSFEFPTNSINEHPAV